MTGCASHRLAAFDQLDTLVLNDVLATYDRMVANGWETGDALAAVRADYRSWLLTRFSDAIALGVGLLELEVTE